MFVRESKNLLSPRIWREEVFCPFRHCSMDRIKVAQSSLEVSVDDVRESRPRKRLSLSLVPRRSSLVGDG